MLESIFVILLAVAVITFFLAIFEEKIIWSGTSLLLWLIIFAEAVNIEVPGDTTYTEYGLNAVCYAFIFLNVLYMVITVSPFLKELFKGRSHWRG